MLRGAGYEVAYKGKWHLTHPSGTGVAARRLGPSATRSRIAATTASPTGSRPTPARTRRPSTSAAATRARSARAGTRSTRRQAERWLGRADLPEPFCLVVSLVNPHDVLGYPAHTCAAATRASEFRDLGVELPPTLDEDLREQARRPRADADGDGRLPGPARNRRRAKLDYVNFYAHLHRVVDEKIGRLLDALGDPGDPGSLRSRTVVFRCADHGEMGLSHGGLRQKAFNAYEETIHVPLVVSNPALFPKPPRPTRSRRWSTSLPTFARARRAPSRRRRPVAAAT